MNRQCSLSMHDYNEGLTTYTIELNRPVTTENEPLIIGEMALGNTP